MIKSKKALSTSYILCFLLTFSLLSLLFFPDLSSQGAVNGISVCLEVIIPSLFPFMVLTVFLSKSGLSKKVFALPSFLISKISGLDRVYCDIFCLSLTGGYPSAAKNISVYLKNGIIDKKSAETLVCFCTNPGPTFLISAVGCKMFLSSDLGIILYASSVITSFILMLFYKSKLSPVAENKTFKRVRLGECFINSVRSSCNSMVIICALIVLFSVIINLLPEFSQKTPALKAAVFGFLEVTSGCLAASYDISFVNLLLASAVSSWCGISIIIQIMAICAETGIKTRKFFLSRFYCVLINTTSTFLLLFAVPIKTENTFISNSPAVASGFLSSPLPAFMLMLCCVCFPLCLGRKKL